MKTLIATAGLTIMFLSAGAFAGNHGDATAPAAATALTTNITVIEKNMAWPLPGQITVDPCSVNRCLDI